MRTGIISPLAAILLFAGCADLGQAPTDEFINYTGTIADKGDGFFIIQSDLPIAHINDVYPTNLPPAFKRNGLRVFFSGRIDDISPAAEYMYLPVRLSSIQTIDDYYFIEGDLQSHENGECRPLRVP